MILLSSELISVSKAGGGGGAERPRGRWQDKNIRRSAIPSVRRRRVVSGLWRWGWNPAVRLPALPGRRGASLAQWLEGRWCAASRQGQLALVGKGREAGSAGDGGRGAADAARALAGAVEGAEGRVLDGGFVVVREGEFDQAVEVLEDFGVALDGGLPVLVDAALELGLGVGQLGGVGLGAVIVEGVGGDAV